MGVEYQHWLIAADLAYRPGPGTGARVHAVLEAWGMAGPHEVRDIGRGGSEPVRGSLPSVVLPETALIRYGEMSEGESIARLVDSDDPAYVQSRLVVLGSEQHVLAGHEEIFVDVQDGAVETDGDRHGLSTSHWAPADADVEATVTAEIPVPDSLTGVFRAAVVLDFGKSLPPFVMNEEERVLASSDFVRAIEKALGTAVLEVGFIY